jgi:hypothetical protein
MINDNFHKNPQPDPNLSQLNPHIFTLYFSKILFNTVLPFHLFPWCPLCHLTHLYGTVLLMSCATPSWRITPVSFLKFENNQRTYEMKCVWTTRLPDWITVSLIWLFVTVKILRYSVFTVNVSDKEPLKFISLCHGLPNCPFLDRFHNVHAYTHSKVARVTTVTRKGHSVSNKLTAVKYSSHHVTVLSPGQNWRWNSFTQLLRALILVTRPITNLSVIALTNTSVETLMPEQARN